MDTELTGGRRFLPQSAHFDEQVAHQLRPARKLVNGRRRGRKRSHRLLHGGRETRIARQGGLHFFRRQSVSAAHLFAQQLTTRTERAKRLDPPLVTGRQFAMAVRSFARLGRQSEQPPHLALDPPGAIGVEERRRQRIDQDRHQRQVVGVRR